MFGRLLDRLLGPRYRLGWPRDVKPLLPIIARLGWIDPELWEQTRFMPLAPALRIWREKHPELFKRGRVVPDPWMGRLKERLKRKD